MKLKHILITGLASLLIIFFISISQTVQAQNMKYPISELGDCRDAKECYLYCEVPENKPACWAYQTYVIEGQVLGDSTQNITFPIVELGNCANAAECKSYCDNAENKNICASFAKAHNLGHYKKQQEILQKAQQELGCPTIDACKTFCQQPDNKNKCLKFAHEIMPQKTQSQEEKTKLLEHAKEILGCDSTTTCRQLCEQAENKDKCHMIISSASAELHPNLKPNTQMLGKPMPTCKTQAECLKVCQMHPDQCPSFKRAQEQTKESSSTPPLKDPYNRPYVLPTKPAGFPHGDTTSLSPSPQPPQEGLPPTH